MDMSQIGLTNDFYNFTFQNIHMKSNNISSGWSQCQCSTSANGVSLSNAIEQHISAADSLAEVDSKKILTFQTLSGYLNKYSPIMPNTVPDIPKIQAKWAEVCSFPIYERQKRLNDHCALLSVK